MLAVSGFLCVWVGVWQNNIHQMPLVGPFGMLQWLSEKQWATEHSRTSDIQMLLITVVTFSVHVTVTPPLHSSALLLFLHALLDL